MCKRHINPLTLIALLLLIGLSPLHAQETGITCPGTLPSRLTPDMDGRVTEGGANNVRRDPTVNSELIGKLEGGSYFYVLEGPVCADGYTWFRVFWGDVNGWTVEADNTEYWIEPLPSFGMDTLPSIIKLDYTPLSNDVKTEVDPSNLAYDILFPEHLILTFIMDDDSEVGTISIYRVQAFDADSSFETLHQYMAEENTNLRWVPFPTIVGAAQAYVTQIKYLSFDGGKGLRFLAQYAQDSFPSLSKTLSYFFVGFTDDGEYFVEARVPLNIPALPARSSLFDRGIFDDNYGNYIRDIKNLLNTLSPQDFQPNLARIDAVLSTLSIQGNTIIADTVEPQRSGIYLSQDETMGILSLHYPPDWEIAELNGDSQIGITPADAEQTRAFITLFPALYPNKSVDVATTLSNFIAGIGSDHSVDVTEPEVMTLGNAEVAIAKGTDNRGDVWFMQARLDGVDIVVTATAATGELAAYEDAILALLKSLDYQPGIFSALG